jgi:hypothetical protein
VGLVILFVGLVVVGVEVGAVTLVEVGDFTKSTLVLLPFLDQQYFEAFQSASDPLRS